MYRGHEYLLTSQNINKKQRKSRIAVKQNVIVSIRNKRFTNKKKFLSITLGNYTRIF